MGAARGKAGRRLNVVVTARRGIRVECVSFFGRRLDQRLQKCLRKEFERRWVAAEVGRQPIEGPAAEKRPQQIAGRRPKGREAAGNGREHRVGRRLEVAREAPEQAFDLTPGQLVQVEPGAPAGRRAGGP